jgi:hypothetical protein
MRKLDVVLTLVLVVVYVPLSLWGGSEHWGGPTDALPFVMLVVGAVFLVFENARLNSARLGMVLGLAIGIAMMGPAWLLYRGEVGADIGIIIVLGCFGLTSSKAFWKQMRLWKILIGISFICAVIVLHGAIGWYSGATRTIRRTGDPLRDVLNQNYAVEQVEHGIAKVGIGGAIGCAALVVGLVLRGKSMWSRERGG